MTSICQRRALAWSIWLLCSLLYGWNALGGYDLPNRYPGGWQHYDYLTEGFLQGHLSLSVKPDPQLLALRDPYDPSQNGRYRIIDATLFDGKYFLYFGPAPVLILLLPWRLIAGFNLPQCAATAAFASLGLGFLTLLLGAVQERLWPTAKAYAVPLAVVLAAHVSWLPLLTVRGAVWELPIAASVAFFWGSLWCLWRFHAGSGRARWAWMGGLFCLLAIASRPTYLFASAAIGLAFFWPHRAARVRTLIAFGTPLALGGALLWAYNYARFGTGLEWGQHYQLLGSDVRGLTEFSPSFLLFNFRAYFLSLPVISPYFPFLRSVELSQTPVGYLGWEELPGALFCLPTLLVGFATFGLLEKRNQTNREPALRTLIGAATLAGGLTAGLVLSFGGACSRYLVEILSGWTPLVAIGALSLQQAPRLQNKIWAGVGTLLLLWTCAGAWLPCFEYLETTRAFHPDFYRRVATTLNYPSHWIAQWRQDEFGPVRLKIKLPEATVSGTYALLSAGRQGKLNQLLVQRTGLREVRFFMTSNRQVVVSTPPLHLNSDSVEIECHAPWLYPPANHPFWGKYPDAENRAWRQNIQSIVFDGHSYDGQPNVVLDSAQLRPYVADTPGCVELISVSPLGAPLK